MSEGQESLFDAARRQVGEALAGLPEPGRSEALAAFAIVRREVGASKDARTMDRSALGLCVASMRAFIKSFDPDQIEGMLLCVDENDWLGRGDKLMERAES
jgi:hypothetical protein